MADVLLIIGVYPTVPPSDVGLAGCVISRTKFSSYNTDVTIIVSAGSGVLTLLGYNGTTWCPIGDINVTSAEYGGVAFERYTPGNGFTHFAVWQKTAGATVLTIALNTSIKR